MNSIKLELSIEDVDFIVTVLGSIPTLQTIQAGKLHLIPMIKDQAQWSLQLQKNEAEEEAVRDKVRILREARQASEREARIRQHEQDKMRDDIERDSFITALGGENVVLETLKEPEVPLTPHGEEIARKEAAEANIRNQRSLREKLDEIAKGEGRIGDPPFPHTQRFG